MEHEPDIDDYEDEDLEFFTDEDPGDEDDYPEDDEEALGLIAY